MATLLLKVPEPKVLELHLGRNRIGRSPECDFQIDDPGVSGLHCELELTADGVIARDCNSTNGTYLDGRRITEEPLRNGQMLRLGEIDLLVESVDTTVAIPKVSAVAQGPPVVLPDGTILCPRHSESLAVYQCTHCREFLCTKCVHALRRHGGKELALCPLCSHVCKPVTAGPPQKQRKFLALLQRTIRLPLLGRSKK